MHHQDDNQNEKAYDFKNLSEELKEHIIEQDYSLYTAIDHACWRYIMKLNQAFFSKHAHPLYHEGLKKTGLSTEYIPNIKEMDQQLQKMGWRAVAVSGFIPPAVFLELQAKKILSIACEIRSLERIAYTPAPDIVHEAAGHAPIIIDPEYSKYLRQYGEVSEKTIFSKEDLDVYEAIRVLSVVKEDPQSSQEDIQKAQSALDQAVVSVRYTSEATYLSRLAWWTTEYGLIGNTDDPKIYGAGLLSSVGESYSCLKSDVMKIPLTLDCISVNYDITRPQPQLFLAPDFVSLQNVLSQLAETMAYKKGGLEGLAKAKMARTITTTELENGLQIGGILSELIVQNEQAIYLKFSGPCQLAFEQKQIKDQGPKIHHHGYSTPIGRTKFKYKTCAELNSADLSELGFQQNQVGRVEFESGIILTGTLIEQIPHPKNKNQNLILRFQNCKIEFQNQVLYDPSWGIFDLACGKDVISVFGGAPDRGTYFTEMGVHQEKRTQKSNLTSANQELVPLYQKVRNQREQKQFKLDEIKSILQNLKQKFDHDWLLRFEILELCIENIRQSYAKKIAQECHKELLSFCEPSKRTPTECLLIQRGLELLDLNQIKI